MSGSSANRKENERTKLIQEKCQSLLTQMLRDEDNKYCVDCDAKGPRWASWNLGVFLCIRCAGIHRNLGVHISRVKSVNLDTWTPEQVISLQQMGNSRARAVYEAQLPDGFRRPQTDTALESFIRAKYEHKKYLAREWVPPSPPKVDWAKEIDEELERQKRKKKAAQANTALGIGVLSSTTEKKQTTSSSIKTTPLPAPLPKPKIPGGGSDSGNSPKTQRITTTVNNSNITNDLLGLSSPTKPVQSLATSSSAAVASSANDANNDSFSNFLSATSTAADNNHEQTNNAGVGAITQNSLAKDEEDFFNQGSLNTTSEKDKSGKLTKDSILALYGTSSNAANPQMPFAAQQTSNAAMFGIGGGVIGYPTNAVGYPAMMQQQPHQQFMTPPNSASMYNAPVMTAPASFTAAAAGGMPFASQPYATNAAAGGGMQPNAFAASQQQQQQMFLNNASTFNAMQMTNHNLMNAAATGAASMQQQQLQQMQQQQPTMLGGGFGGMFGNMLSSQHTTTTTAAPTTTNPTNNLNQQLRNLNIGNVWQ